MALGRSIPMFLCYDRTGLPNLFLAKCDFFGYNSGQWNWVEIEKKS
jgi:hypothetical protein